MPHAAAGSGVPELRHQGIKKAALRNCSAAF